MSKPVIMLLFATAIALVFAATPASAGILSTAKGWVTAEMGAMLISAAAVVASGIMGLMYTKAVRTFRETGEFLTALGMALDDNRLTREELAMIIREGREIFQVWK